MIMPLFALKWLRRRGSGLKARNFLAIFIYFGSIGLAFMFLELSLLPKFTLLLSHPIYSAATVLSSILCFAGLGSMSVSRFQNRGVRFLWVGVAIISAWVAFDAVAGGWIFSRAMTWPLAARMALTVSMISILAFFWAGAPSSLRACQGSPGIVHGRGINGFASVTRWSS
jgi:hypothetical protein